MQIHYHLDDKRVKYDTETLQFLTKDNVNKLSCALDYVCPLCADQIETSTCPPTPFPGKPRAFDYFLCPRNGEFDG